MTPKHYAQHAPLIQWAYLFEEFRPLKTDTCALFWRSAVLTPIKLLLPTVAALFVVFLVMQVFAPGWLPEAWRLPPPAPRAYVPFPWLFFTILISSVAVFCVVAVGLYRLGLCQPVEIEGGLVLRGSCPKCTGPMIEIETDAPWECRKCHGRFLPSVPSPGGA